MLSPPLCTTVNYVRKMRHALLLSCTDGIPDIFSGVAPIGATPPSPLSPPMSCIFVSSRPPMHACNAITRRIPAATAAAPFPCERLRVRWPRPLPCAED